MRPRISLRAFLIGFTLLIVVFGLVLRPVLQRGHFRHKVESLGGSVGTKATKGLYWDTMSRVFSDTYIEEVQTVSFITPKFSPDELNFLGEAKQLEEIWIQSADVGDDFVRRISTLPKLKSLTLYNTLITEKSLVYLAKSPITSLNIVASNIDVEKVLEFREQRSIGVDWGPAPSNQDRALLVQMARDGLQVQVEFARDPRVITYYDSSVNPVTIQIYGDELTLAERLRPLTKLSCDHTLTLQGKVTRKACDVISQSESTRFLMLFETNLDGLDWISRMRGLNSLAAYKVSAAGQHHWQFLQELPQLQSLIVRSTDFDDEDLAFVSGKQLENLSLKDTSVTRKSVSLISTFSSLRTFTWEDVDLEPSDAQSLLESLPVLESMWLNGEQVTTHATAHSDP